MTDIVKREPPERHMDRWAADRLIDWAAETKGNPKFRDRLRGELRSVAAELAGPSPTPVERLLAESAALDWFAVRMHEARYAADCDSPRGLTLDQSEHAQRRIDRTHRRLLATLKTLATVRRLALPVLQVNLARQQVNVAASSASP